MSAALLAANRIQTDIAGLTGRLAERTTNAATTSTEALSTLIHGESGSLHYLFDSPVTTPYSGATPALDPVGPHGGTGHPDSAGHQVFRAGPPEAQAVPAPVMIGGHQESIAGLF